MSNLPRPNVVAEAKLWLEDRRSNDDVLKVAKLKSTSFDELSKAIDLVKNSNGSRTEAERDMMAFQLGTVVVARDQYWMSNGASNEDIARDGAMIKRALYSLEYLQVELLAISLGDQKQLGETPATRFFDDLLTEYFLDSEGSSPDATDA